MQIYINGSEIPIYPSEFQVTVLDLDDAESTQRTADGTLSRDRIAVKRQVLMRFNAVRWHTLAVLMQLVEGQFFDMQYPDPMAGRLETRTFYVGDRTAPVAVIRDGEYWWSNVEMTLTER